MIDLVDIRYVRLGTGDVDAAIGFCTDTMGLELVRRENGGAYLRGDDRDHNVYYFEGDPTDHTVGFEVVTRAELDSAFNELQAGGMKVRRGTEDEAASRRVMDFINFTDPTGNSIDIVLRPFHSGVRYFPGRDAGIQEFSHIGLNTSDPVRDEIFWCENFNFQPNDWISGSALISFDDIHHRIALFPCDRPGVQHVNFQVETYDDVMRSYYLLQEKQVKIVFGPGKHPLSTAQFLYFEGPDGMVYENSWGVLKLSENPDHRARQFPWEQWSLCMWGSVPDIPQFQT